MQDLGAEDGGVQPGMTPLYKGGDLAFHGRSSHRMTIPRIGGAQSADASTGPAPTRAVPARDFSVNGCPGRNGV